MQSRNWQKPDLRHFFALTSLMSGIGNLHGFLPNLRPESYVFRYASMPHITPAAHLYIIGTFSIFIGLWLGHHYRSNLRIPSIPITPQVSFQKVGIFSAVLFFSQSFLPITLGLLDTFFFTVLPLGGIFYLARQKERRAWIWAATLVFLFTIYKVLYAYLRVEMILPTIALLSGIATAQKLAFKSFIKWKFVPIYLWILLFILIFPWVINNRGKYGTGLQRIKYVQAQEEPMRILSDQHGGENVVTRLSLINQLSQVVRITEEDGHYRGKTLAYWKYIWIPRILWWNKPSTATGAWFAHRLDNTYQRKNYLGTHSWSANMTIPGELYLNFGWWGTILGSSIFGYLATLFWHSTLYKEDTSRISFGGVPLVFYLIFGALFGFGADLQFLVNLAAMYLLTLISCNLWKVLTSQKTKEYAN